MTICSICRAENREKILSLIASALLLATLLLVLGDAHTRAAPIVGRDAGVKLSPGYGQEAELGAVIVAQTPPNFDSSYEAGPQHARPNDVITYTIVAVNTSGSVENVVLSDTLPSEVVLVPDSCTYDDGYQTRDCGPLNEMWERDFIPGTRITTTLATTVTAGTVQWPLVNHAYLSWSGGQKEMVFTTTVLTEIPDFTSSYKTGPPNAETGNVITYTIVAANTGDPVRDVVLSDTLPGEGVFVPGSCTYDIGPDPQPGSLDLPCNSLSPGQSQVVWQEDLAHGTRITTTFAVTVVVLEGSARWPLRNCAYLDWYDVQEEMCFTTLVNPETHMYLPLVMRQWGQWYQYDVYEPNDTPARAWGPLESGQVYEAYIWDVTDQDDYYHFTPSNTDTVQIVLSRIPTDCDYDLYVYYYDGQYHQVVYSSQPGNADDSVTFIPVAGQKYYVRVYQYSGFSDQQAYHLTTTYQ